MPSKRGILLTTAIWVLCIAVFYPDDSRAVNRKLLIREEAAERIFVAQDVYAGMKRNKSGQMVFRTSDLWGLHQIRSGDRSAKTISLHHVPEAAESNVQLADDFAVDDHGFSYVPAMIAPWQSPGQASSVIFVLDVSGKLTRTVRLASSLPARRIAVDDDGNLLLLAIDPAFIRRQHNRCDLLHKYSPEGELLASFSPCAAGLKLQAQPGSVVPGPDLRSFREEVDRGLLWVQQSRVYHVLPVAGVLGVFDTSGKPAREIRFTSPGSGALSNRFGVRPDSSRVLTVLPVSQDRFLVEWLDREQQGSGRQQFRYLALHDSAGRALTEGTAAPWTPCVPVFSDQTGKCYFLRLTAPGKVELVRTNIGIE